MDLFVVLCGNFADAGQDDITGAAVDRVARVHVAGGDDLLEVDGDDVCISPAMTFALLWRFIANSVTGIVWNIKT